MSAARPSCVRARLGSGLAHQSRLGWTSLRPAQAILGLARHSLGRLWLLLAELIESALAQAQPGVVGPGQGEPETWPGCQSGNRAKRNTSFLSSNQHLSLLNPPSQ